MRQNTQFDPAYKNFEAFLDFSGGLNTEVSNEKLKENEFTLLLNADLSGRASAMTRSGRTSILQQVGNAQGAFWFYQEDGTYPDLIIAIAGKIYVHDTNGAAGNIVQIPIDGSWTFQTTKRIEAVQYKGLMFMATGSALVEISKVGSAWTAKKVTPYTPTVMEAIYIGTNGLAANPDAYITDGVGTLAVLGIKPAYRYAIKSTAQTYVAYIQKPGAETVEYKWEYKKSADTAWTLFSDFNTANKSVSMSFDLPTTYDVRVSIRVQGTTTPVPSWSLTNYEVRQVDDRLSDANVTGIQTCTRIMVHWDRLILFGDSNRPYQIYVSDLEGPRYFPVSNTVNFDFGKQEPITDVVRFQDMLVVFTYTTIQTLTGKSPEDYQRFLINDTIGAMEQWSSKVVGSVVMFRSREGIMKLRPNPYRLEVMNVDRADGQVKSEIPSDGISCSLVAEDQYWICFPATKTLYRFYFLQNAWVKDVSDNLDIMQFIQYGEDIYNLTVNGKLLRHDSQADDDAGAAYNLAFETKFLDLGAAFNNKKLKRLYVIAKHISVTTEINVRVQADAAIVLTPESGTATVLETGEVVWATKTVPNFTFYAGTVFGSWLLGISPFGNAALSVQRASVRGKCRRVRVYMEVVSAGKAEIFGFGLEFKYKKI